MLTVLPVVVLGVVPVVVVVVSADVVLAGVVLVVDPATRAVLALVTVPAGPTTWQGRECVLLRN